MSLTLTAWEVDEFVEQVALRPLLWIGKDKVWVRRALGQNRVAVKFQNGLADDMSTVHVVPLDGSTEEEAARYVLWLLEKFTSYGERMKVERYLYDRLYKEGVAVPPEVVVEMARAISMPTERMFTFRGVVPVQVVQKEEEVILCPPGNETIPVDGASAQVMAEEEAKAPCASPTAQETPAPQTERTKKKRPTYLERLTGRAK